MLAEVNDCLILRYIGWARYNEEQSRVRSCSATVKVSHVLSPTSSSEVLCKLFDLLIVAETHCSSSHPTDCIRTPFI